MCSRVELRDKHFEQQIAELRSSSRSSKLVAFMSAPRLHPFWRLVLAAIGVLVSASVVQSVGLLALLPFSKQLGVGDLALIDRIQQLAQSYALPLTVLSYPVALGVLFGLRTHVDFYSWGSLGFSKARALPNFARGALTALLTLSVLFSLMWLAGAIRFGGWSNDVLGHGALYSIGALVIFGLGFGAVGLFEETVFRGYALANLFQWMGWRGAVAVQAIVFAAIHLVNGIGHPDVLRAAFAAMPSIALIAVFFALSYRKNRLAVVPDWLSRRVELVAWLRVLPARFGHPDVSPLRRARKWNIRSDRWFVWRRKLAVPDSAFAGNDLRRVANTRSSARP